MRIRKKNRSSCFDYSNDGCYFVTISTHYGISLFGRLKNKAIELNEAGTIVDKYLKNIPNVFNNVFLDEYIIMPDHLHAILVIRNNDSVVGADPAPTNGKPTDPVLTNNKSPNLATTKDE